MASTTYRYKVTAQHGERSAKCLFGNVPIPERVGAPKVEVRLALCAPADRRLRSQPVVSAFEDRSKETR